MPTVLLMLVGIGLLCFTAWRVGATQHFLAGSARAEGVVRGGAHHPTVFFTAADGRDVSFVARSSFGTLPENAAVRIAYDPTDPAGTAMVVDWWSVWVGPLWILPAGLAFTLLPLFGYRVRIGGRYG